MTIKTRNRIRKLLLNMGVPPHLLGYRYLCDAIEIVYFDHSYLHKGHNILLGLVAEMNGTTPKRVERDIGTSIKNLPCFKPSLPGKNGGKMRFIAYCVELLEIEEE